MKENTVLSMIQTNNVRHEWFRANKSHENNKTIRTSQKVN